MEIQPPQSVQINFNNKIITLHNVTIVKNPKIITIDATQYSNFMKGSPVKLNNGATSTTPVKAIPTLLPMKTSPLTAANKVSPTMVIKQAPKFSSPQIFQTVQQKNGIIQFKSAQNVVSSTGSPFKIQTLPVRQQPTVIISPPKVSMNNTAPLKIQLKPNQTTSPTYVITKPTTSTVSTPTISLPNFNSTNQTKKISISTPRITIPIPKVTVPTSTTQTVKVTIPSPSVPSSPVIVKPPTPRFIISPAQKNKVAPSLISPPEAKRPCKTLTFPCIFCNDVFNTSHLLVEHMKVKHSAPNKTSGETNKTSGNNKKTLDKTIEEIPAEPPKEASPINGDVTSDLDDDDESEVNDLIMDLEETQDTTSQDRSDTPESPEFEQHVPTLKVEPKGEAEEIDENTQSFDYEKFEYCSSIMEPICELSYEYDSNDDDVQDENEAMRLYREAMEVNYQQNGIKKRGRRRQRKPKPLMENMTSLNGILAGLLDNSIKVPPGPGRGRRKEMNEQELQEDRTNGVCLFSCNKCDESFKYAGDLAKHVRSHTISSPYQCSICQRKFTHIGSLNTHLRIHSGERPYKCNQCDKSFTQSNSLMVHVKSHLSNKPFQCHHCNKGFLNASSLALHTKTHTGPTTVTCPIDVCGKEFRDNNLLEEHMMTHRQSMLYQCSLCSEKFEQSCLLVQHVKSHIGDKPFQCNQCGKCFTQPGSLNTHLRIHTGEKPFECNICGKKFTQASSLSVHMKVHGERQFKCIIESCKKSYSQEAYLKKHMLKHIEASLNDENNHQLIQE